MSIPTIFILKIIFTFFLEFALNQIIVLVITNEFDIDTLSFWLNFKNVLVASE